MVKINYRRIGAHFRQARHAAGLTQAQVAEHLGIQPNSYSNLERGAQKFNLKNIIQLCVLFHIKPSQVLDDCCTQLFEFPSPKEANNTEVSALYDLLATSTTKDIHTVYLFLQALHTYNEGSKT